MSNEKEKLPALVDVHGEGYAWRWERVDGKWMRIPIFRQRRGLYVSDEDDAIRYLCCGMEPKEFLKKILSIEGETRHHEQRD